MKKKESLKKELLRPDPNTPLPKRAGFSGRIFSAIKFILGFCLLPLVYALTVSFVKELNLIDPKLQVYFTGGIISFLAIYLFVWEPAVVYAKGQKLVEVIFQFFQPLVKFAPYLLPVYTIVLFIVYAPAAVIFKEAEPLKYFVFLFGFSVSLHLVFSARSMRTKQGDFLKANYIFGFSFIYIVNIALLAAGLSFIFKEFSLINFSSGSFNAAGDIFHVVFKQLFLR
ncbi:hypothetical protein D4Q80_04985 [bacterium]|nr:MAG: hypothetical protein D4Q80_04985 [bacterium]